jgi:long-chain acyl-CoA synthetase
MTKHQTLIQRFWHNVLNTRGVAVVANSKDGEGDLSAPTNCGCAVYAVMVANSMTPAYYVPPCYCKSPVSWFSWKHLGTNVAELMSFLSENGFKKGDRAAIVSDNRREWIEADLAIQSLGGITVPIFAHTNADQMNQIIEHSGSTFVFVETKRYLSRLSNAEAKKIVMESPKELDDETVSTFAGIFARRKAAGVLQQIANKQINIDEISFDDLATLIYTSGTTGQPKGSMISHGNIAYALAGIVRHGYKLREDDLYLSALPLAHVYGRVNGQYLALWCGKPTAFCKISEVGEALRLFQPTILLGVPKLWRKIRDAIEVELAKASGTKKRIIKWAFKGNKKGVSHLIADMLVFRKIRNRLGGRLRIAMSGGAALSADVQQFFAKIGIKLCQGYGMTETTGAISASLPENQDVGSSGRITDFTDVAIVPHDSVPSDLGIEIWGPLVDRSKGKTDSKCAGPQAGELWVKGPQIFKGYWNDPKATEKVLSKEGWFKTGDVAVLYDHNFLAIVGRVLRVIKGENGKWIPVDLIEESVYSADQEDQFSVIQVIVPIAGSEYKFTGALVFVDPVEAKLFLEHKGITPSIAELEGDACEFYARHPLIRQKIVSAIAKANKPRQIWERIKRIQIVEEEATVEGGHFTATLKVRPEAIKKKYSGLVDSIYSSAKSALTDNYPEPIDIE